MGLFGDLVQQAMGGFPTKPDAPPAPNVNPQDAQLATIAGNAAALPGAESLAGNVNQFNTAQRQGMLNTAIPNYGGLTGQASGVLSDWLHGVVPPDVANRVQQMTNSRAVAGGYGGSGLADFANARNYGLTSLDIQGKGMSALPGYLNTVGSLGMPRQMDPISMFLDPTQDIAAQQWNEKNRYSRDWLQAQLDSLPDPANAAIAKDVGGMADTVGSMIPYFGAFYSMSQGGGGGGGGGLGGGWLDSLFSSGGGGGMSGGLSGLGTLGGGANVSGLMDAGAGFGGMGAGMAFV